MSQAEIKLVKETPTKLRDLAAEYAAKFGRDENDLERRLYLSDFVLWMENRERESRNSPE